MHRLEEILSAGAVAGVVTLAAAVAIDPAAADTVTLHGAARESMQRLELAAAPDEGPIHLGIESGDSESAHRSPYKAFGLSMLLPGLGQRYVGNRGREVAFYAGEVGLWTTYTVLKIQGNRREEDFKEWAETFAGAKIDGFNRSEEYFQDVSRYLSSDDLNFEVRFLARLIHPGDTPEVRAAQLAYIEEHSVTGDDTWEWVSPERRNDFRVIRHRSLDADRKAEWTLGGLVLLRLISAVEAARGAVNANHHLRESGDGSGDGSGSGLSLRPLFPSGEPGLAVGYSRAF